MDLAGSADVGGGGGVCAAEGGVVSWCAAEADVSRLFELLVFPHDTASARDAMANALIACFKCFLWFMFLF